MREYYLYVLPSRVCWSSKTWFINLVFSSISTWFSMSPDIDKKTVTLFTDNCNVSYYHFMMQSSDTNSLTHVPSMSQFMMKSSSSCLVYRAADPLSTEKE